jgi:hypothetical protein
MLNTCLLVVAHLVVEEPLTVAAVAAALADYFMEPQQFHQEIMHFQLQLEFHILEVLGIMVIQLLLLD